MGAARSLFQLRTSTGHPGPARGTAGPPDVTRLLRWGADVTGRGACRHPDGAARFLGSALRTFAHEIDRHRAGLCTAVHAPSMPLPSEYRAAA